MRFRLTITGTVITLGHFNENIRDTLHAYLLAKRCNEKRVMTEAVK